MLLSVSNIVFITDEPKPGQDKLLAVFRVNYGDPFLSIGVNDFRYYQPIDGDGYITVPAIKTKRGVVRPVSISPAARALILKEFIAAWEALPRPESVTP